MAVNEGSSSKLDGKLTRLSDDLAPSEDFIRHGKTITDKLTRLLQADKTYKVDRVRLAGGMQKKTSVGKPDYDLVAFLNVESSADVLRYFDALVKREFGISNTTVTPNCVKFTYDGNDFDLLFAKNMIKSHETIGEEDTVWRKQHEKLIDQIRMSDDPVQAAKGLSAGLTEAAFMFVKKQSQFVHKVARLAKYWNSKIAYSRPIFGRSTIFELLGIKAGIEEEEAKGENKGSMVNAFKMFLEKVATLEDQRIIFEEFYNESDIPGDIMSQTPLLMDPSSPFNNLMVNFRPEARAHFSRSATVTLGKLAGVSVPSDITYALFEP